MRECEQCENSRNEIKTKDRLVGGLLFGCGACLCGDQKLLTSME